MQQLRAPSESEDDQTRVRRRDRRVRRVLPRPRLRLPHPDRGYARNADWNPPGRAAKEQPGEGRAPSCGLRDRARRSLLKDLTALLVREDLSLHALQRIVDRLRVAPELFRHLLVRRAFEIETQRVRLER